MQRLTKYALLLKAILKKTEDQEQQDTLKSMVSWKNPPPLHSVEIARFFYY